MGFTSQEYWSGLPFPPPGIFLAPGSNPLLLWLLHCRQIPYPPSYQGSCCQHIWSFVAAAAAAAAAKSLQSCPTLCDAIDGSPPGSPVPRILQARILEWVAISSSRDLPSPGIEPASPLSPLPLSVSVSLGISVLPHSFRFCSLH